MNTFNSLKTLKNNDNIVLLSRDKDSAIVILDKNTYKAKTSDMIKK